MTTKVALYCRVSTSTKDQTTENQLRELNSYCDRMGYEVVKIYEDESPQSVSPQNELPPQDAITYTHANTFNTMKKQLRKKKVSKKSKRERIADKSVSLGERLGKSEFDWTI